MNMTKNKTGRIVSSPLNNDKTKLQLMLQLPITIVECSNVLINCLLTTLKILYTPTKSLTFINFLTVFHLIIKVTVCT